MRNIGEKSSNSKSDETDLNILLVNASIQIFPLWKSVGKEITAYAYAITSYRNGIYALWIPKTWTA